MNHICTQIRQICPLISTCKKKKNNINFTSVKEEINAMKSQEVNFQKSQKLLASRAGSSKQTKAGIDLRRLRYPLLKLNE